MRKALIVGVDYYEHIPGLFGCVNDAHNLRSVIERHSDGTLNFGIKLLTGTGPADQVPRHMLKESVRELFADDSEIALFYFAGHGYIEETGGYLCGSDCKTGDDGLSLTEVLTLANNSLARNKVILLDSCHSGIAGGNPFSRDTSILADGMTILTASTAEQYASEKNGAGVFSTLMVDALNGAGSNLIGDITPGSLYAHIDQSLGPWEQRPVFKTNVKSFVSIRKVQAPISLGDLQRLPEFFPTPDYQYPLNPSYEPDNLAADPNNTAKFAVLQRYNRVNLVVPVGAQHMYYAAIESKACRLTVLGEHYRRLAALKRI